MKALTILVAGAVLVTASAAFAFQSREPAGWRGSDRDKPEHHNRRDPAFDIRAATAVSDETADGDNKKRGIFAELIHRATRGKEATATPTPSPTPARGDKPGGAHDND